MKAKYILPIVVALALLVGVGIMAMALPSKDDQPITITLKEDGATTAKLDFSASGMIPGDSREYVIHLKGSSGHYALNFQFAPTDNNSLKDFVKVTLRHGDDSYTYSLSELLTGKTVRLDCVVDDGGVAVVSVIYSMPTDISNEAQGADADFTIDIVAEPRVG